MSDVYNAPDAGGSEAAPVTQANDTGPLTVREAAQRLIERGKPKEQTATPAQEPAKVEQPNELVDETNAEPLEAEPIGEDTLEAEPAEQPPIEPPRSWTKEAKDRWNAFPREAQEEVARIEQSREREFRRSQNEVADKLKGLSVKEQAVEKARQEYDAKLPALMQALHDTNAAQFSDIKTMDDVKQMAAEDPFRKIQWDTHQQVMQAANWELQQAETRKTQEQQTEWAQHVQKENELFAERVPEFADKAKAKALTDKAITKLTDIGFTDQELGELAQGKSKLSIYDHKVQLLILDAVKWSDAQKASKAAVAKPLPSVQRPGVAKSPSAGTAQRIQDLQRQISNSSGLAAVRAAAELTKLRRAGK